MTNSAEEYLGLLVRQNLEKIEWAAVKAIEQQLEIPVVLVLDPADPIARAIASAAGREATFDPIVAKYKSRGVVPMIIWHLPARVAHALLRAHYPDVELFAPLSGPNAYYAVVVSRAAMTGGELQLPRTEQFGG